MSAASVARLGKCQRTGPMAQTSAGSIRTGTCWWVPVASYSAAGGHGSLAAVLFISNAGNISSRRANGANQVGNQEDFSVEHP